MSISKILGSFFSLTNENSLALASLKFDFSLVKVEAPTEYSALGHALARNRKTTAEEGDIHRTARRLGALFEQVIPSTPKLIMTYGLRCSEIILTPGVNPQGNTSHHGAFHQFVGADGTALWAAATSSISSLGVYLLACILADCWAPKEAISIWVELVKSRKEEIQAHSSSNYIVTDSSALSALQEVSRDDLARWDASARAWLRSADEAKFKEKSKLRLILRNISIPFNNGTNTYRKIIEVWKDSMIGVDSLLCGKPQLVNNRTILLALSAWHIFPDLIVLGDKVVNVSFKDQLVPQHGVCTLGGYSQQSLNDDENIRWSLTLSHLEYYGDAIPVDSDGSKTRVTFSQLYLVSLGSLFGAWDVRRDEIYDAAQWLVKVWDHLCSCTQSSYSDNLDAFGWFAKLATAAQTLVSSQVDSSGDISEAESLVTFGQRRAKHFLCKDRQSLSPYFGLRNPCMVLALSEEDERECIVRYYREVAGRSGLQAWDALIYRWWPHRPTVLKGESYYHKTSTRWIHHRAPDGYCLFEYCTAVPLVVRSKKRDHHGPDVITRQHVRWLSVGLYSTTLGPLYEDMDIDSQEEELQKVIKCWSNSVIERGELPFFVEQGLTVQHSPGIEYANETTGGNEFESWITWEDPPTCFTKNQIGEDHTFSESDFRCGYVDEKRSRDFIKFYPISGQRRRLGPSPVELRSGLFGISRDPDYRNQPAFVRNFDPAKFRHVVRGVEAELMNFDELQFREIPPRHAHKYFKYIVAEHSGDEVLPSVLNPEKSTYLWISELAKKHALNLQAVTSLLALDLASEVYRPLDNAMISLDVIDNPLGDAAWFEPLTTGIRGGQLLLMRPDLLDRSATLACIAYFEAGDLDLESGALDSVFALAANNSIYVSERLLADPFDDIPEHKIRRIVGNIGFSNISLLLTPNSPRIRPLSNNFRIVKHATYNQLREDNFKGTSMHLLFSDWTAPVVNLRESRTIDRGVLYVESIIRVLDAGEWVADLDFSAINFNSLQRLSPSKDDHCHELEARILDCISIDNWEEFLDNPESIGIFRAKGNWVARLAAVSIMFQREKWHSVYVWGPGQICLACMEDESFKKFGSHRAVLRSICID